MGLTVKRIAGLLGQPGRYLDERGLYLQVPEAGTKNPRKSRASWLLRYQMAGKEHWMGLGALADFSLDEARERARKARQLRTDGIDPLQQRSQERAARLLEAAKDKTFAQVADEYYQAHAAGWSVKHAGQFTSSLRDHVMPELGDVPVAAIDNALVLKVLRPIWGTRTVTAKRVANRIESALDFATAAKYRAGDNPARWAGHLEHLLAAPGKIAPTKHLGAIPYGEVPALVADLQHMQGVPARALELLILTAVRSNEALAATWDEIDLEAATWTIPAERTKKRREHKVPLAERALEILRQLPREDGNDFVFIGARTGRLAHDHARRVLHQLRGLGPTVHGFRSSFRDWAAEQTSFPHEVCEQALAHAVASAVERAYRRGDLFDKRRKLMEAWATYCTSKPVAKGARIVAINERRK